MEQDVDIAHSQPTAPPRRRAPPSVSEGAQLHRLVLRMVAAYGPIRPPLGRLISAVRSTTAFCAVHEMVLSALTRFNSPSHVAARIRASGSQFEFAPSRSEREQRCDAMRCDAIRFDAACNNALNLLPQEPQRAIHHPPTRWTWHQPPTAWPWHLLPTLEPNPTWILPKQPLTPAPNPSP